MSEKKFADYQQYYCKVADKIVIEYPKFCPTCVPNDKYIEPTWYATTEPYLDEKNCLYKFNVTRIIDDLRLDIDEDRLEEVVSNLHILENKMNSLLIEQCVQFCECHFII